MAEAQKAQEEADIQAREAKRAQEEARQLIAKSQLIKQKSKIALEGIIIRYIIA